MSSVCRGGTLGTAGGPIRSPTSFSFKTYIYFDSLDGKHIGKTPGVLGFEWIERVRHGVYLRKRREINVYFGRRGSRAGKGIIEMVIWKELY